MSTALIVKDSKQEHSYKDPHEEWVSTADKLPSLGLEVLAIADGELTVAHLCDESEVGYHWYSWGAAKCLHSVTHWQFHPALPREFEIRQREMHAEGLTAAGYHCLGDADHELAKVATIKESLKPPICEEENVVLTAENDAPIGGAIQPEEPAQASISAAEERNTSPDEFGWYDATQVQPYAIHGDICESNPVLGKTAEGRILLVNFASEGWEEGQGGWMYSPGLGLESVSLMDEITHWKPLPDSYFKAEKPWVGTDRNPYSHDAPKVRFWHEQQAIAKAEEGLENVLNAIFCEVSK